MTGWLLVTFINTLACTIQKHREKKELTAEEFIELCKTVKTRVKDLKYA